MAIDRNGQLWVTELGGNILLVDSKTGKHQVIHHFDDVVNGGQHQGLLGMTLDPNFLSGKGENVLYAAYAYKGKDEQDHTKIVKLTLDKTARKVEKTEIVLDNLASFTDHQGGRLRLGPDGKLYYTIGNQGANQYSRTCYADRRNACQPNKKWITTISLLTRAKRYASIQTVRFLKITL